MSGSGDRPGSGGGSGDRGGSGNGGGPGDGFGTGFEAFVETRGHARAAGYRFLGRPPAQRWWQAYREHTSFEQPTLIVESADGQWRAYLGGIPSVRRDVVGTVIHYAVVLGGPCSDPVDPDGAVALRLMATWLTDIRAGDVGGDRTGAALDAALSDDVENMIAESGEATWRRLQGQVKHALSTLVETEPVEPLLVQPTSVEVKSVELESVELNHVESRSIEPESVEPESVEPESVEPGSVEPGSVEPRPVGNYFVENHSVEHYSVERYDIELEITRSPVVEFSAGKFYGGETHGGELYREEIYEAADEGEPADWMGRLDAARPAAAFQARLGELLAGTPGRALAPNLADSPADIADLTDDDSPLAVLVLDEPGLLGERLVQLTPEGPTPKKAPPPATGPATPPAPSTRPSRRRATAAITTVLLALALLVLLAWTTRH